MPAIPINAVEPLFLRFVWGDLTGHAVALYNEFAFIFIEAIGLVRLCTSSKSEVLWALSKQPSNSPIRSCRY